MLLKSGRERQKISYNICTCCLFILLRAWFQNGFWHIFCYFQTNLNTKVHHSELVLISASLQCEDYRTNMHPRWLGRERYANTVGHFTEQVPRCNVLHSIQTGCIPTPGAGSCNDIFSRQLLGILIAHLILLTWLILPVVICLSQRLSHACFRISFS